jgi:thiol-disulfide isomerase/thioredoxin
MMQYYLDDFIAEKSSRMNNKWVAENQPMLKQEGFGKPNTWEFGAKYVIDSVASAEMRNYLLLKLVMRGLEKGELKPVRNLLELFYDNCTDKEMTGYIQKEVAEFQILQPGEFGPDIIGFDVDGKQVSLTGLKGKFIFVDVWATWCGPCLGQIPSFKKLANAYSGRNIVFIKYSVDDDRQKWSDFLGKNEPVSPDCLEWISENGTKCRLMDDYKFDAIPRYLFFDAKGRIINIWLESPGSLLNSKYLDKFLDHPDYQ